MLPRDVIYRIRYFTALVTPRPRDPDQPVRQQIYLRALQTIPNLSIHYGHFLTHEVEAPLAPPATGVVRVLKTEEIRIRCQPCHFSSGRWFQRRVRDRSYYLQRLRLAGSAEGCPARAGQSSRCAKPSPTPSQCRSAPERVFLQSDSPFLIGARAVSADVDRCARCFLQAGLLVGPRHAAHCPSTSAISCAVRPYNSYTSASICRSSDSQRRL